MIAGMTGNMMSLSWQPREHGKRRRRNRRTTASNVHWTADIAGVGSGEKPSACLISKTNVCNYVLTQDVHGTCGRTQIKVAESVTPVEKFTSRQIALERIWRAVESPEQA